MVKGTLKKQHLTRFALLLVSGLIFLTIMSKLNLRIDLTSDQRYTLSDETKEAIKNLDQVAFIKIYLDNESLPAELLKLKRENQIMLHEFRAINGLVNFEFYDPLKDKNAKDKNAIIKSLSAKGIIPTTMLISEEDAMKEQIFFPWALLTYNGKEIAVPLLKSNATASPLENLQNSINALEYEWMNAFKKAQSGHKPLVGFLRGHQEMDRIFLKDIQKDLRENYDVKEIDFRKIDFENEAPEKAIKKKYNLLNLFDVLVIAKPQGRFTDLDKFLLDQYIMNGGKVLWALDPVQAEMDSLSFSGETIIYPKRELNIDDMLFKYGARVNTDIIKDISAAKIPIQTSMDQNRPRFKLFPWVYFPIIFPEKSHPITNNLGTIRMEFASSVDTIITKGIKKTILLKTSANTGVKQTPSQLKLTTAFQQPKPIDFRAGQKPLAVLLEGKFESYYKNKVKPKFDIDIAEKAKEDNRMIIIGDGDIIKNPINKGNPGILGYDRYENRMYANKKFLINCIDYLAQDQNIIKLRNRDIKIRLLDKQRIKAEYNYWQMLNTLIPAIILIVFALISHWIRKRKYTR
ncbi:MAG: gliding motility-associated ABC transporter substrate-binding protein GldG [Flavobacteriales bacterium]|jgi:ABC-2 type transport system permease protein|nr:gliding motility-associated ABC transporter substrate-binding protein GldG [Flavobacteriales bacterium]